MEKNFFGIDHAGNEIYSFSLKDALGNCLTVLNYGATIQSLVIHNKNGAPVDVVLGFDNLQQYQQNENRTYFGAVCGRVANRIENALFVIDGQSYPLAKNNHNACLHGGLQGFDKKFFDLTDCQDDYMVFSTLSEDGEEGFPGMLALSVKYTFRNGLLLIEYRATTSQTCPVNITNHTYFNLQGGDNIQNHKLQLNSAFYLGVRDDGVANGMVIPSQGTCFDFKQPKLLATAIAQAQALQPAIKGLDHHFFCDAAASEYRKFGTLFAPDNTLCMDIFTNQCGAQIYTGNFIPNMQGKNGMLAPYSGIAIETQFAPNNLNYSHLASMLLHRGQNYYHKTGYRFYF